MGLRKRLKDLRNWCPQPSDRFSAKLKRYSIPITVALVATLVLAVSFSVFSSFSSQPLVPPAPVVNRQPSTLMSVGLITIEANGSVEPADAPIQHDGDIYTLMTNLYNSPIVVLRNNVVVAGSGYALQGIGSGVAINLTCSGTGIANFNISNWAVGVLGVYDGNNICSCNLTDNNRGIAIYANDYSVVDNYLANNYWAVRVQGNNSCISNNQITDNAEGFYITSSSANTIYRNDISGNPTAISTDYGGFTVYDNNFSNNTTPVCTAYDAQYMGNTTAMPNWDYGGVGNYWADYQAKHPTATNSSGVWSQPYTVDANSGIIDQYPLAAQVPLAHVTVTSTNFPSKMTTPLSYLALIFALVVVVVALLVVLSCVHYRQRKNNVTGDENRNSK